MMNHVEGLVMFAGHLDNLDGRATHFKVFSSFEKVGCDFPHRPSGVCYFYWVWSCSWTWPPWTLSLSLWLVFACSLQSHLMINSFFFFKIFLSWTIFKVCIEFVTILLLLFMYWFFGQEVCGWDRSFLTRGQTHTPAALEGKVLATGPPRKFCVLNFFKKVWFIDVFLHD